MKANRRTRSVTSLFTWLMVGHAVAQTSAREDVLRTLGKAATFMHDELSRHGGYVYQWSGDLKLREAEGITDEDTLWVQPPGTPRVGEAFLDAFEATADPKILGYAREAALALAHRQLHSGGWYYSMHFAGEKGLNRFYRYDLKGNPQPDPLPEKAREGPSGWDVWRTRRFEGNLSILDDDTTQSALRFMMRADQALKFSDSVIHESALRGLEALLLTQYPNGAWSASFDRLTSSPPAAEDYPIKRASFPADYPRKWPKDFTGCYVLNDDLTANCIHTLIRAYQTYGDGRYLAAAKKGGEFFFVAQLPEPQPAWAQQYDKEMHPVWSRAFEVAAVSSRESETVMETLMLLCRATGDKKWLTPIPAALSYLKKSLRPDGTLARYYEMRTNTPLYFQRKKGGGHELTTSDADPSSNYGFIITPILDDIEAEHQRLLRLPTPSGERPLAESPAKRASEAIASLDARGAWVERGIRLRHHKIDPPEGVIQSETFAQNISALCQSLAQGYRPPLSQ